MRIMKCPRKSDGRNVYIHFQTSVTSGWGDSTKYEVAVQIRLMIACLTPGSVGLEQKIM